MINVVLFEPEIPGNSGNIMRTCVATDTKLHFIKPLGFSLDEKYIRRSGVNYIDYCDYTVYENWDDFYSQNKDGEFYFLTRYGHKPHTSYDYSDSTKNIYFVFGKESTGIPREILKPHLDKCMRMPMTDKVRALNLSNTVAIMVYEALRQQDYNDLLRDEPDDIGHKGNHFIEDFEGE
jgi:tRNA (cytidine/uridine-2'-O-)-methyltransferase